MFPDFITTEHLVTIVITLVIVAVTFVLDKFIRRSIANHGKKVDMEPHAINILKLVARLIVVIGGVVALMSLFKVPTDLFLAGGALTGTAIGFASTQTVGNFLAGFYIMISRPFMVRD
ncbi:mechanosensitive ion channel [Candidatus Bathyarchaeota archaeon]|nr:mechanosensitive ion channel [Candidatus Bathyarchaeota archaeon]